jgi:UDP-N-acetylenolpyruvoylglucosamine reductase
LQARLSPGAVVRVDEPLARRTTLRVGGPADLFVEPAGEADLAATLRFCGEHRLPRLLLGRGSNLLVRDGGVRGVVVSLAHAEFAQLRCAGGRLQCGAGVKLKQVAQEARRQALAGFEFLEGIPGSLGGALRMNAGAMGGWMFEVVESVRCMDERGEVQERARAAIEVTYRCCPLLRDHVALSAVLRGQPGDRAEIEARMSGFSAQRWRAQPAAASAGLHFQESRDDSRRQAD